MKRAWHRAIQRIRHLVDEAHKRISYWLCSNHRWILIPKFETQRMAQRRLKKRKRRISRKTAWQMYTWAHYRFRMRLKEKAREFPWCRVVEVREDYTTRTCGRCGAINHRIGGSKVFWCADRGCGYKADRDISAARNILLRFLTEHDVLPPLASSSSASSPAPSVATTTIQSPPVEPLGPVGDLRLAPRLQDDDSGASSLGGAGLPSSSW